MINIIKLIKIYYFQILDKLKIHPASKYQSGRHRQLVDTNPYTSASAITRHAYANFYPSSRCRLSLIGQMLVITHLADVGCHSLGQCWHLLI